MNQLERQFHDCSVQATTLLEAARSKLNNRSFSNVMDVRKHAEGLYKRIEAFDLLDIGSAPTLRQDRKKRIGEIQQLLDILDGYVVKIEQFEKGINNFENDEHCQQLLRLVNECDRLFENQESKASNLIVEKFRLFEELESLNVLELSNQLNQNYHPIISSFVPISNDYKTKHDKAKEMLTKSFSVIIKVKTEVQPFKSELPPLVHLEEQVFSFLHHVEELMQSNIMSQMATMDAPNSTLSLVEMSKQYVSKLNNALISLEKYSQSKYLKDIRSRHVMNILKGLEKMRVIHLMLNLSPKLKSISSVEETNIPLQVLEDKLKEMELVEKEVDKLKKQVDVSVLNAIYQAKYLSFISLPPVIKEDIKHYYHSLSSLKNIHSNL